MATTPWFKPSLISPGFFRPALRCIDVALFSACLLSACANDSGSGTGNNDPALTTALAITPGLEHIELMPSTYVAARKVSIWLPVDYQKTQQRYPVLYMHDGQNVFDPNTAYAGNEWGVDEAITQLSTSGEVPAAIVVGVWNTEARWREYMPRKIFDRLPTAVQQRASEDYSGLPLSDEYLRFLVEELKPYIDTNYRTLSGPEHTAIMGSSMGALISFYALTEYPQVFGAAAGLSIHWPLIAPPNNASANDERIQQVTQAYTDYLAQALPQADQHRVYFDYGSEHLDAYYGPYQAHIDALLEQMGWQVEQDWQSRYYPGATHNEISWRARLNTPLGFLLGRMPAPSNAVQNTAGSTNPARPIEDEVIYFVMPDRFADGDPSNNTAGIPGGPDDHGYDPTHKGYFHGGDFKGLIQKLDYLQELGISALWLTPIFKNKAVQGDPPYRSAGYHGYWITDFTQVDPHLGSNEDFKSLVMAAHQRGMKVIMDIVTNHTADVIQYRGCNGETDVDYSYRSIADYPYQRRCGVNGAEINIGFNGDDEAHQTLENFAHLKALDYAYQAWIPEAEAQIKVPAWLNDPRYYHNRGNSHWEGESSLYGDFAGLDDLFTEHPRVLAGMIDIYRWWISEFKVDGFRIDTAKHVNDSFWRGFIPAIQEQARAVGIDDFYIFGEVYGFEPSFLGRYTREAAFPAVLDFALQSAIRGAISQQQAPSILAQLFAQDNQYQGDPRGALILPSFLGNHDMGRFGHFLIEDLGPDIDDAERLQRAELAYALLFFSRGVPVIYYGDEQGFTGLGNDQEARQDMFPSQVESYNQTPLIGTTASTAEDNFNSHHPLFQALARMAKLYRGQAGLRRGKQEILYAADKPGLLLIQRGRDPNGADNGARYLVVMNTAREPMALTVPVSTQNVAWKKLIGNDDIIVTAEDSDIRVQAPALAYAVYRAQN